MSVDNENIEEEFQQSAFMSITGNHDDSPARRRPSGHHVINDVTGRNHRGSGRASASYLTCVVAFRNICQKLSISLLSCPVPLYSIDLADQSGREISR